MSRVENMELLNQRSDKSWKGIMEEDMLDQDLPSHLSMRHRRKVFACLLAAALLLFLALSSYLALNYLVPRGPGRTQGVTARASWYLQSGQSRADARTLASVIRFMMETDSDAGTVYSYSNLPVAVNASPSSLKS